MSGTQALEGQLQALAAAVRELASAVDRNTASLAVIAEMTLDTAADAWVLKAFSLAAYKGALTRKLLDTALLDFQERMLAIDTSKQPEFAERLHNRSREVLEALGAKWS